LWWWVRVVEVWVQSSLFWRFVENGSTNISKTYYSLTGTLFDLAALIGINLGMKKCCGCGLLLK
jgi:hypothetical protein